MKYIYISVLLGFLTLQSCESFLEEGPRFELTDENSIVDYEKAIAAVGGIYSKFQNDDWSGKLYLGQASKSGFFKNFDQEYNMAYSERNFNNNTIWRSFYIALNAANFAIEGIGGLADEEFPTIQDKENLLAEAHTLRGWINLNILWNFGHWWAEDSSPYGLVYRDMPADLGNVQQPRISVGESYDRIIADLDYGIEKGKGFSSPKYVSSTFAKAIKAKLLLYRGASLNKTEYFQESLSLVNGILNTQGGSFKMESNLEDLYEKAWDSNEVLFARYLENDGSRTVRAGHYYPYGLVYAGNKLPLPAGGQLTAGLEYGVEWFSENERWPLITGDIRSPEPWDETFCFAFKKLARLGSVAGKEANPRDEKYAAYYFRYAELYLMKAELLARTGASVSEALAPLNEMRSKRVSPALPALQASSKEELMDIIFKEIIMETFLENGSELFASLRFEKNGRKYIEEIKPDVSFQQNRLCYPIPYEEMLSNKLIEQNPELD